MAAAVIQVEEMRKSTDGIKSVIETFESIDDVGMVLVPMKLFALRADVICDAFKYRNGEIVHNPNELNVFTQSDIIYSSQLGKLDKLTERWTLKGNSKEFLDDVIDRLKTRTTVMTLTLYEQKLGRNGTEIAFLVFIKPCSPGMTSLIKELQDVKTSLPENKKFAVEYDIAPDVVWWARNVLKKDMTCIGGRLGITSGDLLHPMFQWNVTAGCLPLLPISLIANLIYRTTRKVKYIEKTIQPDDHISILGSICSSYPEQEHALVDLTRIAVTLSIEKCRQCGYLKNADATMVPGCVCSRETHKKKPVLRSMTIEMEAFTQNTTQSEHPEEGEQKVLQDGTYPETSEWNHLNEMNIVTIDDRRQSFSGLSFFDLEVEGEQSIIY